MALTLQELGLDHLTMQDRVELAQQLWDSVAEQGVSVPLTMSQRKELERRLADSIARPDAGIPWEDVKQRALARAKQ